MSPPFFQSRGPFRNKLKQAIPPIIILTIAIFLHQQTGEFDYFKIPGQVGPDAWPKLILRLLMAACAFQIIAALAFLSAAPVHPFARVESEDRDSVSLEALDLGSRDRPLANLGLASAGLAASVVYLLAFQTLGFFLATFLYMGALVYIGGYRKFWPLVVFSASASLAFMFMFMRVVYVSLPIGEKPFSAIMILLMRLLGIS